LLLLLLLELNSSKPEKDGGLFVGLGGAAGFGGRAAKGFSGALSKEGRRTELEAETDRAGSKQIITK
jgi:hypothetical protein